MAAEAGSKRESRHWWSPHLRGHLLLFDRKPAPAYDSGTGVRLLLAAVFLEVVRLLAVKWLWPSVPLWLLLPVLPGFALLMVPMIPHLKLSQLGLRPWRSWTATEKSYFVQLVIIANLVFPLVFAAPLANRVAQRGIAPTLLGVFVPYLFFGFYQEFVYRGMVQVEAMRRWGVVAGILVANVLYTFGPLHWYYFASPATVAVPMFGSIFTIGLFFGVLYWRSGNLWLVAIPHAIGNAYIITSVGPVR